MEPYIRTFTGRKFWPLTPRAEDVAIEDVAHALAHQGRFTGHTSRFVSVAEHSLIVAFLSSLHGHGLWGLLHDASEAYLVDVPSPIKHAPEFTFYRAVEKRIQTTICDRFGLSREEPPEVKAADRVALILESELFMPPEFAADVADWVRPTDDERTMFREITDTIKDLDMAELFLREFNLLTTAPEMFVW